MYNKPDPKKLQEILSQHRPLEINLMLSPNVRTNQAVPIRKKQRPRGNKPK